MRTASIVGSAMLSILLLSMGCDPVKAAADAAPEPIDARPAPTCENYCATIQASCTDVPQYPSEQACVAYCKDFGKIPVGAAEDMSGNTVGCRTYHATVAVLQNNQALHCPHAGPSGGDVCGSWCENYCYLAQLNCTGSNQLFADEQTCLDTCAQMPANGHANDESGDTIQCRIHFLGLANTEPPGSQTMFCPIGDVPATDPCTGSPP